MTKKARVQLSDQWRDGIKVGLLIKRLYDNSIGTIELTALQIKSIEIILRKLVPDLKQIDHGDLKGNLTINMVTNIPSAPNTLPKLIDNSPTDT